MSGRIPRDVLGQKFGMLTAMRFSHWQKNKRYWIWRCDCGNEKAIQQSNVVNGHTKSCGCLQKESAKVLCESRHLGEGVSARNTLYGRYQRGAEIRLLVFELTLEDFAQFIASDCHYCRSPPSAKHVDLYYNGIDRVDNYEGYTKLNCVPCCFICNRAKCDMLYDDFQQWLMRLKVA